MSGMEGTRLGRSSCIPEECTREILDGPSHRRRSTSPRRLRGRSSLWGRTDEEHRSLPSATNASIGSTSSAVEPQYTMMSVAPGLTRWTPSRMRERRRRNHEPARADPVSIMEEQAADPGMGGPRRGKVELGDPPTGLHLRSRSVRLRVVWSQRRLHQNARNTVSDASGS
ncbi:hypothetical protein OH76DRAFT_522176 [Lentinus brumalis]|uniref:Uncharacterized protein n=1 Tax=Lentinus brumalis TaxID=2498619 RepID=A0A371DAT0_9APHY|nr:hypothetical protein OH76DRAFT_522176 [Polyporus brumalis]